MAGTKPCAQQPCEGGGVMAWDDFHFSKGPGGEFGRPQFRLPPVHLRQLNPQFMRVIVGALVGIWIVSGAYIVGPAQRGTAHR